MDGIITLDLLALAIVILALLCLGLALLTQRRHPYRNLRKNEALLDAEKLMHEAAEKGLRLTIGLGAGQQTSAPAPANLAGLPVLRLMSRRSVFNDQPAQALAGDGALAALAQLIVRGKYQNAFATELFKPDFAVLAGASPYAYLAGLLPEVNYRANAGVFLFGSQRPEIILAASLAEQKDLPLVAGTDDLSAQAALFATNARLCLGEDALHAGAALETDPGAAASVRAQDWLRVLAVLGLLVGAALKLLGVWQ
ncbi:MAG: DUF6754 domain-containing protein [Anaerolineaceae bacterium]